MNTKARELTLNTTSPHLSGLFKCSSFPPPVLYAIQTEDARAVVKYSEDFIRGQTHTDCALHVLILLLFDISEPCVVSNVVQIPAAIAKQAVARLEELTHFSRRS
jgi:hypothetical protein